MGPVTGRLTTFSKDPSNPKQMLVGDANGGLYRSADGGSTWQPATTGLVTPDGLIANSVRKVWFVPNAVPSVALVGASGSIYRSTDGGRSWTKIRSAGVNGFVQVGKTTYASTDAGVLASTDAGLTWSVSLAGSATAIDSGGGTTLAALGSSLYSLVAATGKWTNISTMLDSTGKPVAGRQLAIRRDKPSIIYARLDGGYGGSLYVSTDSGLTFTLLPHNGLGVQVVVPSSTHPDRVYVAGDGTTNWTTANGSNPPTYTSVPGNVDTREIDVEPNGAGEDRCYFGSDQGLYVLDPCSTGMGKLTAMTPNVKAGWITGFAVSNDGQSMIAMVQDYSAQASNDAGQTWHGLGISEDGSAAFSPTNPQRCYGFNGGLYASTDGCKSVNKQSNFGSNVTQASLAAFDPVTPTTLYVAAGPVVISTIGGLKNPDGTDSFSNTGWPFTNAYLVVIDPNDRKHIAVGDGGSNNAVSFSFDGGTTWTKASGLPASGAISVVINPLDGKTVVAATSVSGGTGVYRSSDGGRNFTKVAVVPATSFNMLAINSTGNPTPYLALASSNNGAWLSKDLGETWERLDTGLITHKFTGVQWLNGLLYFSTYGQGILKSSIPLQ